MTALNFHVSADSIDVFTDTAIFDLKNGGTVEGFGSKAIPLPHQGAVLAATGFSWVSIMMAGVIASSGLESFDQLIEHISTVVAGAVSRDPGGRAAYGNFELVVAGISESRNIAEAYVLYSYANEGWPAWHVKKFSSYTSPRVSKRFDPTDVLSSGIEIMEEQRRELCGARGFQGIACHAVGGVVQHTRIDREGISIRVLKRWPDAIGKKIEVVGT